MFQTKLHVEAGGAEAFLPVRDVLEQDLPEHDDEVRLLNLQYRNRLEHHGRDPRWITAISAFRGAPEHPGARDAR